MGRPMKTTIVSLLVALSAPLMASGTPPLNFKKPRTVVFLNFFTQYDVNGDQVISEAEFQGTVGASDVPVVTEYRFLYMTDGLITDAIAPTGIIKVPLGIDLVTYVRYAGGLRVPKPSKWTLFELADDDNDGFLDPEEYALTRNAVAATNGSLGKSFNKLDKNDDGLISPTEYGLNIKV
jgi:hypothetical protein